MIGSEHLSHMLSTDTTGGRVIGEELTSALKAAHDELGVSHVRAHAILGDDLGVYREVDGEPVHDFTGVDRVYDHLRSIGMYPVVELSFMPHDLASDPSKTVFEYGAIVSPPKDWQRWHDLIRDLVAHLADRYGLEDLVEHWSFEVWNEANLEVFWSGTPEEYLQLYDVTAAAVRSVDQRLRVGGPSSAASGWVEELLAHAERSGSPVDFVTTHTYGSPPLDFVPMLERYGREGIADLVDRVGRHPDALQRGQRRGVRRHLPAARHGVGDGPGSTASSRCRTGWSPTTSRSSGARRRCCTAASAPAPSASCASRAGGRSPCSSGCPRRASAPR